MKQLKQKISINSNLEHVNIQIEQIDRKMRSLVIKEHEETKVIKTTHKSLLISLKLIFLNFTEKATN